MLQGNIYEPVNSYSYVEDTKVSISIKKTTNKYTLKQFSMFFSGCLALEVDQNDCWHFAYWVQQFK